MGSCVSGNYDRRSFVTFADTLPCVDLAAWRKRGWLRDGCSALGICEIPQPSGRLLKAYAECDVESRFGLLRLRFDVLPSLTAELACTPQPIGGFRWWLVCPLCEAPRGKLYCGAREGWGCRTCLQLRYRSQHLRPAARASARCERYFERLGSFHWVAEPCRPRYMLL
jgi:hypothetical protein